MQCVQAQFRNKLCRKPFLAIAKGAKSANTQYSGMFPIFKNNFLFKYKYVLSLISSNAWNQLPQGYFIKTM